MIRVRLPIYMTVFFGLAGPLAGCVGGSLENPGHTGLVVDGDNLGDNQGSVTALSFAGVCIAGNGAMSQTLAIAESRGWRLAGADTLEPLGLANTIKQVLEIPGGGARFRESQSILTKTFGHQTITLVMEERFTGETLLFSTCRMIEQSEPFIPLCAALGRTLSGEPARNARYPKRKAHFINWAAILDGRSATIACERAPDHPVGGYFGNVLTVTTDFMKPQSVRQTGGRMPSVSVASQR